MSKTLNFLRGSAVALMLSAPAFADDSPNADTVVATVNGTDITLGQMIVLRANLDPQYLSLPDDVLFNGLLDQLVQQTLLASTVQGETPKRVALALENQRTGLLAASVLEDLVADAVDEAALEAAYAEKYAGFEGPREFNASHILVESEEDAAAIAKDIRAGADFAETAKAKSTGPSGPNGGQLGWFGPGQMVAPFEAAVETLEVGQVSDPVQTQFGWHVIILNDTRTQEAPTLDQVRPEITAELQRNAIDAEIARIRDAGSVDTTGSESIDPAVLKQIDLLEN